MNLLFIQYGNPTNPHSHGGLSQASHEILKRLAQRHNVTVYTGLIAGSKKELQKDNVTYIQIGRGDNKWINRLTFSLKCVLLDQSQFDLITILWDRYSPIFLKSTRTPTIIEIHADFFNAPSKLPLLEPLARGIYRMILKKCGNVISVAHHLLLGLRERNIFPKNSAVIFNGIPEEYQNSNGHHVEGNYLLFLGRIDIKIKGLDWLIDAYLQSSVEAVLVIAGTGQDVQHLHQLIQDKKMEQKIQLKGWVHGEEKLKLIQGCLALCLPSRSEGFPLVPLEAAALGKPVIATRIGDMEYIVNHQETGLLVEKENVDQLSKALQQISTNKDLRITMGKKGRELAQSFSWDVATQKREAFFKKVIGQIQ